MKQTTCSLWLLFLLTLTSFECLSQNQTAMRHEFVTRGKSNSEMAVGNYAVLSVTDSEANAKQTAQEIQKLGYAEVAFGYLSVKKLWYVYVSAGDDVEKARTIRDKYQKVERFKEAWILTVHE